MAKTQTAKLEKKMLKLQDKAARNMAKANKTRTKLDKARATEQVSGADRSFGDTTPS